MILFFWYSDTEFISLFDKEIPESLWGYSKIFIYILRLDSMKSNSMIRMIMSDHWLGILIVSWDHRKILLSIRESSMMEISSYPSIENCIILPEFNTISIITLWRDCIWIPMQFLPISTMSWNGLSSMIKIRSRQERNLIIRINSIWISFIYPITSDIYLSLSYSPERVIYRPISGNFKTPT